MTATGEALPGATVDREHRGTPTSMVERMTVIMDAFEDPTATLTLEEIVARTGLPRSTTHRILDQLARLRWVDRTERGYSPGPRAHGPGRRDDESRLRHAAAPHLHDLQLRTGLVVHLSVLDGTDVVYLDKLGGRAAAEVPSRVGGRAPAHSTAGGKAILALLPPDEVETLLRGRLCRRTPRTIADAATLRQELHRIRQRHGLAFERGESVPGIACVAAAARSARGPGAAISLCGRLEIPQLEGLAPLVVEAVQRTTRALRPDHDVGGGPSPSVAPRWSPETIDRVLASAHGGDWI